MFSLRPQKLIQQNPTSSFPSENRFIVELGRSLVGFSGYDPGNKLAGSCVRRSGPECGNSSSTEGFDAVGAFLRVRLFVLKLSSTFPDRKCLILGLHRAKNACRYLYDHRSTLRLLFLMSNPPDIKYDTARFVIEM